MHDTKRQYHEKCSANSHIAVCIWYMLHDTTPQIDPVGYTKNAANGPAAFAIGVDGYQRILHTPPTMWTLCFKITF